GLQDLVALGARYSDGDRGVVFSSAENLHGGTGNDRYRITNGGGGLSGSIQDDGGINWLDYGSTMGILGPNRTAGTVDLAAHTATGVAGGVYGVENVGGGEDDDRTLAH